MQIQKKVKATYIQTLHTEHVFSRPLLWFQKAVVPVAVLGRPRLGSVAGSKRSLTEPPRPCPSVQVREERESAIRDINGVLETQRQRLLSAPQPSLIIRHWLYGWRTPNSSPVPSRHMWSYIRQTWITQKLLSIDFHMPGPKEETANQILSEWSLCPSLPHQDDVH